MTENTGGENKNSVKKSEDGKTEMICLKDRHCKYSKPESALDGGGNKKRGKG